MVENVDQTEEEILNQKEQMIEKSALTEIGVAVPEMLVTEEDEGATIMYADKDTDEKIENEDEDGLGATYRQNSLAEFMNIENEVKHATMNSREGEAA